LGPVVDRQFQLGTNAGLPFRSFSVVENAPASAPNSVGCAAAASVREGLEETLAVLTLGLSDRLRQSLATTNAIESLISRTGM
jgi:hypothetical protein